MAFLIESNRRTTSGDKFVCGKQPCLSLVYTAVTRAKLRYKFRNLLPFFFPPTGSDQLFTPYVQRCPVFWCSLKSKVLQTVAEHQEGDGETPLGKRCLQRALQSPGSRPRACPDPNLSAASTAGQAALHKGCHCAGCCHGSTSVKSLRLTHGTDEPRSFSPSPKTEPCSTAEEKKSPNHPLVFVVSHLNF